MEGPRHGMVSQTLSNHSPRSNSQNRESRNGDQVRVDTEKRRWKRPEAPDSTGRCCVNPRRPARPGGTGRPSGCRRGSLAPSHVRRREAEGELAQRGKRRGNNAVKAANSERATKPMQGWANVGFQCEYAQHSEYALVLLSINHCIYLYCTCNPTFAHPCDRNTNLVLSEASHNLQSSVKMKRDGKAGEGQVHD